MTPPQVPLPRLVRFRRLSRRYDRHGPQSGSWQHAVVGDLNINARCATKIAAAGGAASLLWLTENLAQDAKSRHLAALALCVLAATLPMEDGVACVRNTLTAGGSIEPIVSLLTAPMAAFRASGAKALSRASCDAAL